jgi:hypothetical protein
MSLPRLLCYSSANRLRHNLIGKTAQEISYLIVDCLKQVMSPYTILHCIKQPPTLLLVTRTVGFNPATLLRLLCFVLICRGMLRRSPLYQEILYALQTAPNPHGYEKDVILTYRLGYFADGADLPTVISLADEQAGRSIVEYYGNQEALLNMTDGIDCIVIPATQISRSDICTPLSDSSSG